MLRLDYISCLLTIVSTILVGRRLWQGWIVAGINSVIICLIGLKTSQIGFVPANLFCLGIYGYNLVEWRSRKGEAVGSSASFADTLMTAQSRLSQRFRRRLRNRVASDDGSIQHSHRVRSRRLRR